MSWPNRSIEFSSAGSLTLVAIHDEMSDLLKTMCFTDPVPGWKVTWKSLSFKTSDLPSPAMTVPQLEPVLEKRTSLLPSRNSKRTSASGTMPESTTDKLAALLHAKGSNRKLSTPGNLGPAGITHAVARRSQAGDGMSAQYNSLAHAPGVIKASPVPEADVYSLDTAAIEHLRKGDVALLEGRLQASLQHYAEAHIYGFLPSLLVSTNALDATGLIM